MVKITVAVLAFAMANLAQPRLLLAQSSESQTVGASARKASANNLRRGSRKRARLTKRRADRHLSRGLAYYDGRQFESAIAEFLAGYDVDPRPAFLFALGQSERRSGDCASATVYYRRFLTTSPPDRQVQAATMHLEGCKQALQDGPGKQFRQVEPAPVRTVYVQTEPAPEPSPWYRDWVGNSLLGVGTASVVAGAALVLASRSAADRASWVETYAEYDREINRARRARLWGISALAAGTALVAGAAYRFHSQSQKREDRFSLQPDIQPLQGGVAVSLGGRF